MIRLPRMQPVSVEVHYHDLHRTQLGNPHLISVASTLPLLLSPFSNSELDPLIFWLPQNMALVTKSAKTREVPFNCTSDVY